jgi:hypothetical protein
MRRAHAIDKSVLLPFHCDNDTKYERVLQCKTRFSRADEDSERLSFQKDHFPGFENVIHAQSIDINSRGIF